MPHATNSQVMRDNNRKLLLNLIRLMPISRAELAMKVHLTRASVTMIIDELIEQGLVEEREVIVAKNRGRRRVALALKEGGHYFAGVNISRNICEIGAVDMVGNLFCATQIEIIGREAHEVVKDICRELNSMKAQIEANGEELVSAGICAPGPVNYRDGSIVNPPDFEKWQNIPVCKIVTENTGIPAFLERDTNARALDEKYFGGCKDVSNFILLQIKSGVGAGIMIGDRLYRGARGMGAEIGHMAIGEGGPLCSCGNHGCLEAFLATSELLKGSDYSSLQEAFEDENEEILGKCVNYLTIALTNAVNLFDLERIVITGEFCYKSEKNLSILEAEISKRVLNNAALKSPFVLASKEKSPVRIAAMAAVHRYFEVH